MVIKTLVLQMMCQNTHVFHAELTCTYLQVYLVQSRTTRQRYAMKVLNKQRVIQKEQVRNLHAVP